MQRSQHTDARVGKRHTSACKGVAMADRRIPPTSGGEPPADAVVALYPNIAAWVQDGWIEIGRDDYSRSFVRALNIGGMVWEGKPGYPSLHDALQALDAGIAAWLEENG